MKVCTVTIKTVCFSWQSSPSIPTVGWTVGLSVRPSVRTHGRVFVAIVFMLNPRTAGIRHLNKDVCLYFRNGI